jgi:hypothetical protein
MGFIFTIIGAYTSYRLWGDHTGLAIFTIIATLYQASSLNEMFKEKSGIQPEDRWQTSINMFSSILIIGLFVYSFFS